MQRVQSFVIVSPRSFCSYHTFDIFDLVFRILNSIPSLLVVEFLPNVLGYQMPSSFNCLTYSPMFSAFRVSASWCNCPNDIPLFSGFRTMTLLLVLRFPCPQSSASKFYLFAVEILNSDPFFWYCGFHQIFLKSHSSIPLPRN